MKKKRTPCYANDHRYSRPYPNAADNRYFTQQLLDRVTSVVTGAGIVFILLFLLTM